MKVFTHGSMVNFQASAREMFAEDLQRLFQERLREHSSILFGTIDLDQEVLNIYGTLIQAEISEDENRCVFTFSLSDGNEEKFVEQPFEELLISHEARFDILDEEKKQVEYSVLYVSFLSEETGEETTYFFADESGISHPLACVAQFWEQVHEVGRDTDFNVSGCAAHDLSFLRK